MPTDAVREDSMIACDALALFLYNVDFDEFVTRVFGERAASWAADYRAEWLLAWQRGFTALWGKADHENRGRIVDAALFKYGDEARRHYFMSADAALADTERKVHAFLKSEGKVL